ncbi:MAG: hypothetical protein JOY83_07920 [Alphaproteobacteria bacterium]|nr:hypothetical protein [Alphaproteobacteria bacterium]
MIYGLGAASRGIFCALFILVPSIASAQLSLPAPLAAPKGFVGRMTVSPDHGPAGSPVQVTAEGLPADTDFQLVWRTVRGSWKVKGAEYHGREYEPAAFEIATVRTDGSGNVAASFTVPEDYGFLHDVVLQQGERLFIQAGFAVDMSVRLSPETGPPGTPITVEVKGIGWRPLENSWTLLYDNHFTGWISAVTTAGSAIFTIPASGRPGDHVIQVLHGEFTFPYRNMQQSPEADRPRFALHFTVTPDPPVLPAPEKAQAQQSVRGLPEQRALQVAPPFAGVGEAVAVSVAGLTPGKRYPLGWTSVIGNRVGGHGWNEGSRPVAEAVADASGRAQFNFAVPDDLGGAHALSVESGGEKQTGSLWIKPTAFPLDIQRGPAGTSFTVHLNGVGWTETANIYTVVYDNSYIGYACAFNSHGDVTIPLIATGDPGWHFIDLYPAIYRGEEQRPRNFLIPQLSYAADHPGEDLPAFHFAFEVTEE